DAVIHEVVADRVVPPGLDRDLDLRADAVGARNQERLLQVGGNLEQSAKATERAARALGERALDQRLDPVLAVVGGVDVDAGGAVVERRRLGHGMVASNATSW